MSENEIRKYVQSVFPFVEAPSKEKVKISQTKRKKILANDLLVPVQRLVCLCTGASVRLLTSGSYGFLMR
jgi:thiamine monophosphate synthase